MEYFDQISFSLASHIPPFFVFGYVPLFEAVLAVRRRRRKEGNALLGIDASQLCIRKALFPRIADA